MTVTVQPAAAPPSRWFSHLQKKCPHCARWNTSRNVRGEPIPQRSSRFLLALANGCLLWKAVKCQRVAQRCDAGKNEGVGSEAGTYVNIRKGRSKDKDRRKRYAASQCHNPSDGAVIHN